MSNVLVGGQAVLEGVMMRAPGVMTIAVRRQNGAIEIRTDALSSIADKRPWLKKPFIRGVLALVQSLVLGFRALNFSSAVAMQDIEAAESKKEIDPAELQKITSLSTFSIVLIIGLTAVMAIGVFFLLPLFLTEVISRYFPFAKNSLVFNAIDGIIRIIFLLAYITGISLLPDIRRVFQYHGAEHKVIHAYEAGLDLAVETARKFPTLHPRCGTAFLLTVMVIAMLLFSLIPADSAIVMKAGLRIALLPVIAGVSFELIRHAGENKKSWLNAFMTPGLWLQKITTREPDDSQIEVALSALTEALQRHHPCRSDIII